MTKRGEELKQKFENVLKDYQNLEYEELESIVDGLSDKIEGKTTVCKICQEEKCNEVDQTCENPDVCPHPCKEFVS